MPEVVAEYAFPFPGAHSPHAVRNCLCPDGKRRWVRIGDCDTFFSRPASVQVWYEGKRHYVRGFVTGVSDSEEYDLEFKVMYSCKNAYVFGQEFFLEFKKKVQEFEEREGLR